MVDNGQVQKAIELLKLFLSDNDFSSEEKDSKQMMTSVLGILLKSLG
jgi:hypothetical protein